MLSAICFFVIITATAAGLGYVAHDSDLTKDWGITISSIVAGLMNACSAFAIVFFGATPSYFMSFGWSLLITIALAIIANLIFFFVKKKRDFLNAQVVQRYETAMRESNSSRW